MKEILLIILAGIIIYTTIKLILPRLLSIVNTNSIKEISKNPEWIMKNVKDHYYGFQDIDIITAESKNKLIKLPLFRVDVTEVDDKKMTRYELLISPDTPTDSAEIILKFAMLSKLQVKHNINPTQKDYIEKSLMWLSILCYLLDGGDITMSAVSFEEKERQKTS